MRNKIEASEEAWNEIAEIIKNIMERLRSEDEQNRSYWEAWNEIDEIIKNIMERLRSDEEQNRNLNP